MTAAAAAAQAISQLQPLACRANFRVLSLIVSISGLAAFNAMYVPLRLEQAIDSHPRRNALLAAAQAPDWPANLNGTSAGESSVYPHTHSGSVMLSCHVCELLHKEDLSTIPYLHSSDNSLHL